MHTLVYDGSFEGFLCAVYRCYADKIDHPDIQPVHRHQINLFDTHTEVLTDVDMAQRVWKGIQRRTHGMESRRLYMAWLSEVEGSENTIYRAMQYILEGAKGAGSDFSHPDILAVSKLWKSVSRERHRMTAFVRFKLSKDGIYFANVAPDFNVLPVISKHFSDRYADQRWIIYDLVRKYGIHYDLEKVEIITLNFDDDFDPWKTSPEIFDEAEIRFQDLWQNYFQATNITERINTTLHVKHVPRRYWKYLSEKQELR